MNDKSLKLLKKLDNYLAPKGEVNSERFSKVFIDWSEGLAIHTEPVCDNEDSWDAWNESTMKHQVFSYWPTNRPKELSNCWPKDTNDLPWVLVDYANDDEGILRCIERLMKKY